MHCTTDKLIVIRGGGDIASGVAHRLKRCGFRIVVLEVAEPTTVRRKVAFADAVFQGETVVEGIAGKLAAGVPEAVEASQRAGIPVLVDPEGSSLPLIKPGAVVDCILAKKNLGTHKDMAPVVIGVGPGFAAPEDVHAVIETKRGHDLGRVIWEGSAFPDTGVPGNIGGYAEERILRACGEGVVQNERDIGALVRAGDVVCHINGTPVAASVSGVLRGLIRDGSRVYGGMKIGDVDPRGELSYCYTISDKARAVGGGVLEALLALGAGEINRIGV